ncbi:hypothetical protein PTKIN_Ptkin17bG0037900 [Pterospermum kingtungense]
MSNSGSPKLVSSPHSEYVYTVDAKYCKCKKLAPLVTSWSEANPGRRFYGCRNYDYDPVMCRRAKQLLRTFHDSEQRLANQNELLRKQLNYARNIGYKIGFSGKGEYGCTDENIQGTRSDVGSNLHSFRSTMEADEQDEHTFMLKHEVENLRHETGKLKEELHVQKHLKEKYKTWFRSSWFCLVFFIMGLVLGSSNKTFLAFS